MLNEAYNVWAWAGTLIGFGGIGLIANAQPGGIALGGGAAAVDAAFADAATDVGAGVVAGETLEVVRATTAAAAG